MSRRTRPDPAAAAAELSAQKAVFPQPCAHGGEGVVLPERLREEAAALPPEGVAGGACPGPSENKALALAPKPLFPGPCSNGTGDNGLRKRSAEQAAVLPFEVVAGDQHAKLGFTMGFGKERCHIFVKAVTAGQWAESVGIRRGMCLVAANGRDVTQIPKDDLKVLMAQRPLALKCVKNKDAAAVWAGQELRLGAHAVMAAVRLGHHPGSPGRNAAGHDADAATPSSLSLGESDPPTPSERGRLRTSSAASV